MAHTLEQQRAAYAWQCVQSCTKDYTNLAKGAPALIMGNGLMQTLAFYASKGKDHHKALNGHLCAWLQKRSIVTGTSFPEVMATLHKAESCTYRCATEETMALLKWIRQYAPAVSGD